MMPLKNSSLISGMMMPTVLVERFLSERATWLGSSRFSPGP